MGRVGDDNDIVVDDLQVFLNLGSWIQYCSKADHNAKLELEDERDGIKGTKDWCNNVAAIAAYKERAKEALGEETNGWHWDGFRRYFHAESVKCLISLDFDA